MMYQRTHIHTYIGTGDIVILPIMWGLLRLAPILSTCTCPLNISRQIFNTDREELSAGQQGWYRKETRICSVRIQKVVEWSRNSGMNKMTSDTTSVSYGDFHWQLSKSVVRPAVLTQCIHCRYRKLYMATKQRTIFLPCSSCVSYRL